MEVWPSYSERWLFLMRSADREVNRRQCTVHGPERCMLSKRRNIPVRSPGQVPTRSLQTTGEAADKTAMGGGSSGVGKN
ncbi:hypothetical protein DNTS_014218 [Danionella cerebrum]|uniref:Uncharacterized protein n=1 Tax=Danionella cerebrum TaxID=2873325 RepID=A0A553MWB6_9TELE|nr:hypothetical protein DNTS_014218 [Danionella translucida]